MAVNPMQRRTRNSFLLGFLIALVIMFLVVLLLLYRMKNLNEAKEALEAKQKTILVTKTDLASGQEVTMDDFKKSVITVDDSFDTTQVLNDEDFEFIDDQTEEIIERYDEDGELVKKKLMMQVGVPAGSIVTKDMVVELDDQTTHDQRIQEYSMIMLPSQLKTGDYIDIRYRLPNGQDFVVVSKKKVLQCNLTSVWLKMTEAETLTLSSAIVEAYRIEGVKLYAVQYSQAGKQDAAIATYPVNQEVYNLILKDPNILEEAKQGMMQRYSLQEQVVDRNRINMDYIDPLEGDTSGVLTGVTDEATLQSTERQEFIEEMGVE